MRKRPLVQLIKLGLRPYMQTWELQQKLVQDVKKNGGEENFLVIVEHSPVYTTGIRTRGYSKIEEDKLKTLGADFVRSNRGGLITFHGPGQIVAYPILNLRKFFQSDQDMSGKRLKLLGMKWYIDNLEQVVIDTLKVQYDMEAFRSPHTGVWVDRDSEKKICAMGVHNSDLVTSHGLALNCNTDLSWFDHIVPCGIEDKGVTSITKQIGRQVDIKEVEPLLIKQFKELFHCEVKS